MAVHDAEKEEIDEGDRRVEEWDADPADEASLIAEVIERGAPGLRGEGWVIAEGEDDDPLDPFAKSERFDVIAVDDEEGEEGCNGEEEGFVPAACEWDFVLRFEEEVDKEADGDGGSFALGEAGEDAAEDADEGDSPVLGAVEEDEHGGESEESAEPVMGGVESAEEDEAEGKGCGQESDGAAKDFVRGAQEEEHGCGGDEDHEDVRDPEAGAEEAKEEGVKEVCTGSNELEVVAIGHLAGDDAGAVSGE
jgi:hypothetical protein